MPPLSDLWAWHESDKISHSYVAVLAEMNCERHSLSAGDVICDPHNLDGVHGMVRRIEGCVTRVFMEDGLAQAASEMGEKER